LVKERLDSLVLKCGDSTANDPIATLTPGTRVQLIDHDERNGFFHVKTDTAEGWLWARNIKVQGGGASYSHAHADRTRRPSGAFSRPCQDAWPCRYAQGFRFHEKVRLADGPSGKTSCTYSQARRNVPASTNRSTTSTTFPRRSGTLQTAKLTTFTRCALADQPTSKTFGTSRSPTSGTARTSASRKRTVLKPASAGRSSPAVWTPKRRSSA
jgi:hypothetical protein